MSLNNRMDIIDSRDVERLLEFLEDELEIFRDEEGDIIEPEGGIPENHANTFREWKIIRSLSNEGSMNAGDWDSCAMIRQSYFTEYCKEMLQECGDLPKDIPWYIAIDWEMTSENMMQDYVEVDYVGVTYYVRS